MTERPILMSAEMVRAILDGKKTQTRRPVRPQPARKRDSEYEHGDVFMAYDGPHRIENPRGRDKAAAGMLNEKLMACPFGVPGDRLWVRETWYHNGGAYCYRADYEDEVARGIRWCPSLHMPREASRIMLEITDVRVQRVQKISVVGCRAELGCVCAPRARWLGERRLFSEIWNTLYSMKPGLSWAENPWVWAVTFKVVEACSTDHREDSV